MLVSRSFLFTAPSPRIPKSSRNTLPEKLSRSELPTTILKIETALDNESPSSYESGNTTSQTSSVIMANTKVLSSDPVVIPTRNTKSRDGGLKPQRYNNNNNNNNNSSSSSSRDTSRYGPRIQQTKKDLPPAVAALLANTAIPRPGRRPQSTKRNEQYQRLTVDAVLNHNSEKECLYNSSIERSPLDLLLSPPDDLDDADVDSDSASPSYMTSTTMSSEDMGTPSLIDSSSGEASPSPGNFPLTPSFRARQQRRVTPNRKQERVREPANSPPLEIVTDHPLSESDTIDIEELDFRVFGTSETQKSEDESSPPTPKPRKSAFKSNLTASLRALRSAATALSNLAAPTIRPDDFLTRSIMTLDPRVPFTDERMPPRLEDMGEGVATPALRRYLNPTTNAPIEAHLPHSLVQTSAPHKITASIQLQTYKVSSKALKPVVPKRGSSSVSAESKIGEKGAVVKQRDMRENSDFIRVAVMEMLMRRNGKLADNVPGRARWALPPRQASTKEYVVTDGVPARWIGVSAD